MIPAPEDDTIKNHCHALHKILDKLRIRAPEFFPGKGICGTERLIETWADNANIVNLR